MELTKEMETRSIIEVEESVQDALEALPFILRSSASTAFSHQIGEALKVLAPAGYRPVVELQENGRRKRRTASADNWMPETGEILISFTRDARSERPLTTEERLPGVHGRPANHPVPAQQGSKPASGSVQVSPDKPSVDRQEQELCCALDEVERQGRAFVALKWFRDDVLPARGFAWAADAEQRHAVLAAAIEKGLIVTSRVPNPRSPFPTTALRLNRSKMPDRGEAKRYSPVRVQGEPLSSTILRDRGTN
jgi:hypothetical protein